MTSLLNGRNFQDLFESFRESAYRLESRSRYNSPDESSAIQRFQHGNPDTDYLWSRPWLDSIRAQTAEGKQYRRVRVVDIPPQPYSRYALWSVQGNLAAGEDIRYLPRDAASQLGIPHLDVWLFDSVRVALLHFDKDDVLLGAELVAEPEAIRKHCVWRDVAWDNSLSRQDFLKLAGECE
ncbi:DUF6879 family protein [Nonomuraea sp. NPDC050404]|uniref:DUF6879 family protein n=1 Tax=Nonomuraea sp. NPDC050404 TaxID=3155783 RepID=UPI0033DD72ED